MAQWLDPYAADWSEARSQACLAAEVELRWEPSTLDRALWCLEDRRMTTEALIAELMSEQTAVAHRAVVAVSRLPSPRSCIESDTLQRMLTPPVEQRDDVRRVRSTLARAEPCGPRGATSPGPSPPPKRPERCYALRASRRRPSRSSGGSPRRPASSTTETSMPRSDRHARRLSRPPSVLLRDRD